MFVEISHRVVFAWQGPGLDMLLYQFNAAR
jgi:hypothetical protein